MGFLVDLFKPKKPLNVLPNLSRQIAASPSARATLPQARQGIKQATGRGILTRAGQDTSTFGQVLTGVQRAFGGQAHPRTVARTAPQAFQQFIQPATRQILRVPGANLQLPGISQISQKFGGPKVTIGNTSKFLTDEGAAAPVRMAAGTISTLSLLTDLATGREVRPQDLFASSGTFFEGYFDTKAPGAVKGTVRVGIKNFKRPIKEILFSRRMAQNVGLGAGTGLSVGLQENYDAESVGKQIVNSLDDAAIGAILAGGLGAGLDITGRGIGPLKRVITREINDSFKLVKGKVVLKQPRRVRTTRHGPKGAFKKDSQAGFIDFGAFVPGRKTPKELQSLAQEARKFDTAEEFVKAQPRVFHGTPDANIKTIKVSDRGDLGPGIYLARERKTAENFSDMAFRDSTLEAVGDGSFVNINTGEVVRPPKSGVVEADISKLNIKQLAPDEFGIEMDKLRQPDGRLPQDYETIIQENFKNQGFDGIELRGTPRGENDQILIFPEFADRVLTKSQLTDIYNQATKGRSSEAGFFNPGEIVSALGRLVGRGKQASPDVSSPKNTIGELPPSKVGNLNMSKLGIPNSAKHEVADFLTKYADTENKPVSFREIEKMANDLGLTPADVTRAFEDAGGQLSAKILALRKMEITAVRKATEMAKQVDPNNPKSVKEYQKLVDRVVVLANARKERAAETGRALAAQKIEAGESQEALKSLLEMAKKVDPNNRNQLDQLGELIKETPKATFWDKLAEFAAATKLTSIKSVERNWIGSITAPIYDPIKQLLAGTIDAAVKGVTGGKRANFAMEAIHDVTGTFTAIPRGTKNFLKALVSEEFETGATVDISRNVQRGAIGGTLGKVVRFPFRMMNDQFFYTIAEERSRRVLAHRMAKLHQATGQTYEALYRQFYETPPVKLQAQIQREAKEAVYREDLGAFSSKLRQALDALPFRMGKIITPFYTTPTNILRKFAREKSALGLISKRNWDDIRAGGAARNEAIAKMMMGSTISFGAMSLAFTGHITGRGPKDPAERDLLYQSGWQPYSYWTGKGWRSYANLGEITLVLGTAADIAEVVKEGKEGGDVTATDMFARSAIIAGNSIFNQSFFTGISDALNAVSDTGYGDDPTKQASRFAANLISGIVTPSAVRQVAGGTDVLRKPEGIIQQVMSTIPGLRERLPSKLSQFGDEIRVDEDVVNYMTNPMRYTERKDDPVIQELIRLDTNIGFPSRRQIGVPMSQETYNDFTKVAGQEAKNLLEAIVKDPQYQALPDEDKKDLIKEVRDEIRTQVREGLAGDILIGGITDRRVINTSRGAVNAMFQEIIKTKDWREASQEEREVLVESIAGQLELNGHLEPAAFDFIKFLR